ncbi:murein L,D-transpeptidase catalytic domain family protein [Caulobacter sp. KR2-114]|uniref:murein L,D-transpeptidase catalytic domain family protein n=1 Tax=Caulobacter sp. KR2-114 TaxID=3400912 RepID=UPI003C11D993
MSETRAPSRRRLLQIAGGLAFAAAAQPALAAASTGSTERVIEAARAGLARVGGRIAQHDVVAVADFSRPSSQSRLFLVDMAGGRVDGFLVAHGRGSDPSHSGWLSRFSNAPSSNCTSEGAYLTGERYEGAHGHSMRLVGLDASNSNALSRAIVVHQAAYVGPQIVRACGVLGRSEGCFAVSSDDLPKVLGRLGPGRLLVSARL